MYLTFTYQEEKQSSDREQRGQGEVWDVFSGTRHLPRGRSHVSNWVYNRGTGWVTCCSCIPKKRLPLAASWDECSSPPGMAIRRGITKVWKIQSSLQSETVQEGRALEGKLKIRSQRQCHGACGNVTGRVQCFQANFDFFSRQNWHSIMLENKHNLSFQKREGWRRKSVLSQKFRVRWPWVMCQPL